MEQSLDGKGFVEVASVNGTSWSTGSLPHGATRSFRVRSWNQSGRSFPTEVLTGGTDHLGETQALIVQGFDRLSRTVKGPDNPRDYVPRLAAALRRGARSSLAFDAASNEAVKLGRVALGAYDAVVWSLGEESTQDETFDPQEQLYVSLYLATGGALLVTGAEVGWDLDWLGSAADRAFFRNTLGATYLADDANTYGLQAGLPGTVSDGVPAATFDDGSGPTYDVDYADVLAPTTSNGVVCLRYANGLGAAVQTVSPSNGSRVLVFGLPLDTVLDEGAQADLLQQSLAFLLPDRPLQGPNTVVMGQVAPFSLRMTSEANAPYLCAVSEATSPPVALPLGGLLPLRSGGLLQASLVPSPVFQAFSGTLDAAGAAAPALLVPPLSALNGFEVFVAALTVDPATATERRVTNWLRVRLQL